MYVVLVIALVAFILTWLVLRYYSRIWVRRPINPFESLISGMVAWLHLLAHIGWYAGIVLLGWEFIVTHNIADIWILLFAALLTGYAIDFYVRSKDGIGVEDTNDFLKEALQFRRSAQHRLDVLELMRQRRAKHKMKLDLSDPSVMDRLRLQENLNKEDDVKRQLSLLQRGNALELTEFWKQQIEERTVHPFIDMVEEVRIDPQRKRLMIRVMFAHANKEDWKDDTNVLRLNRQVYDFFRLLNAEPWFKPYAPFIENYFLICRSTKRGYQGEPIAYPFMKVGMTTNDIQKLEGTYFNPRRLSKLAAVAFANGEPV